MQGKLISTAIFLSSFAILRAQPAEYKMTKQEYIEKYKEDAIKEMLMNKIPASIILAQGMLESGNGNSALAVYANNHFGIKCHLDWQGNTFIQDDDTKDECFRKYPSVLDSYNDHTAFLKSRSRYSFLFDLKSTDYVGWANGLKLAGYATDPKYTERLIKIIEENKLYQYDVIKSLPNIKPQASTSPQTVSVMNRKVMLFNNIKFITVKAGDSMEKICKEFDIDAWQVRKYNDLSKSDKFVEGEKIYLQHKKRKALEEFHIVKPGENMHSISQLHGIKLKLLYRKNRMSAGEEPKPGEKLYLRGKKKD